MNKYLYIMSFKDSFEFEYCKIGVSNNVKKRKQTLQKDIDFDLKIIYEKYLENTYNFELEIKKEYKAKNVKHYIFGKFKPTKKLLPNNTEWFHLQKEEIRQIKKKLDTFNYEIKKPKKKLSIQGCNNFTKIKKFSNKSYLNGQAYYKLSLKQYNFISQMLGNNKFTTYNEIDFLRWCLKSFQSNKKLTEKQYNYLKYLATK
tara:strand:- start:4073 stop:4675 length:603 start_codon:yes stop_codon:yes gene_type:complete